MSRRILIADDHAEIRKRVRSALKAAGFEVCGEAVNGADAIEKTKALQPDLITLNLSMPIMGGLDAIPQIVKSAPATKIVVFSVDEADSLQQEARRRGAHGYVSKCSPVSALIDEVNQLLDSQ